MNVGRPKNQIARSEQIHLRLTKLELEKIDKIAKKNNISRTEAILRGIDLLINFKPKKFKNLSDKNKKSVNGVDVRDI